MLHLEKAPEPLTTGEKHINHWKEHLNHWKEHLNHWKKQLNHWLTGKSISTTRTAPEPLERAFPFSITVKRTTTTRKASQPLERTDEALEKVPRPLKKHFDH